MINTKDQEELFRLIADYLERDMRCIAIGGTAMMFRGYKAATKDIGLVFSCEEDRMVFVKAIGELGYKEKQLAGIYDAKRSVHKGRPKMYTRGDERFDLFVEYVFGFSLEFNQDKIVQRQDFIGENELIIYILPKEELILLKAITGRERDDEDIKTIMDAEKDIDWMRVIGQAVKQEKKNPWILIDLEESLKKAGVPKRYLEEIYKIKSISPDKYQESRKDA